jgi:hypothetical protein
MHGLRTPDDRSYARVLYTAGAQADGGPHGVNRKMSFSSCWAVDTPEGAPYNPPTADEAAPKSANEIDGNLLKWLLNSRFQVFKIRTFRKMKIGC